MTTSSAFHKLLVLQSFEDELVDIPAVPPLSDPDAGTSLDRALRGTLSDNSLMLFLCLWIMVNTRHSDSQALYQTVPSTLR